MNTLSRFVIVKPSFNMIVGLFLAVLIVFLQEGFSYYLSIQVLALLLVLMLIIASKPSLIKSNHLPIVFVFMPVFIIFTASFMPVVISRNSLNILFTVAGILVYAFLIYGFVNIRFKRVDLILSVIKYASASVIIVLVCLIALTDSSLFPFLDRGDLLLQNQRLITNYSSLDVITKELAFRAESDLMPRIDLFYGETSYLAIVLCACTSSFMISSKLVSDVYVYNGVELFSNRLRSNKVLYIFVVLTGVLSLLYIQSLSSIMYAILIFYYAIKDLLFNQFSVSKYLIFTILVVFVSIGLMDTLLDSYEYVSNRIINMQDSLSASQRFGSLLNFVAQDYFFGLNEVSRIPKEGFHNGFFYIIAISGAAGILYMFFLLRTAYLLAKPLKMSLFLVFLILAIVMQNGAVFSPNKVVLFAMILLPLACSRVIYARKIICCNKKVPSE